jgi:holo-[acyl-carrier protein] synthase
VIIGLGIDVVHIDRMQHWNEIDGIFERYFHPDELATSRLRGPAMIHSLAARFAAKEAFGKAIGTGLRGIRLQEIQVQSARTGKPSILLSGRARAAFEELGGRSIHLSLTHERDNAIAVVVIEGGEDA